MKALRTVTILLAVQLVLIGLYLGVEWARTERPRLAVEVLDEPAPALQIVRGDSAASQPAEPHLVHFWATWCGPCEEELPALLEATEITGVPLVAVTDERWLVVERHFGGAVPTSIARGRDGRGRRGVAGVGAARHVRGAGRADRGAHGRTAGLEHHRSAEIPARAAEGTMILLWIGGDRGARGADGRLGRGRQRPGALGGRHHRARRAGRRGGPGAVDLDIPGGSDGHRPLGRRRASCTACRSRSRCRSPGKASQRAAARWRRWNGPRPRCSAPGSRSPRRPATRGWTRWKRGSVWCWPKTRSRWRAGCGRAPRPAWRRGTPRCSTPGSPGSRRPRRARPGWWRCPRKATGSRSSPPGPGSPWTPSSCLQTRSRACPR